MMTPRERVMSVLRGREPDRVPFTVYETKLPRGDTERALRNRGLVPVRRMASYWIQHPNVTAKSTSYTDDSGRYVTKTAYETPFGTLWTLVEPAGFTSWQHEYLFKTPDDYKALSFMIADSVIVPNYGAAQVALRDCGEDILVRDTIPLEPLQAVLRTYMGTECFCYEWMDRRDEVLKIVQQVAEVNRKTYGVVADSPLEFANYGGNVVPQIVGVEAFERYYIPHYNEAAEALHKKGKLIGTHMDGMVAPILAQLGQTDLDYIEAYDAGMSPSIAEAKKAFGNKVIWSNWPSGWQHEPILRKKELTTMMLREAEPGGFIMGITEDVPDDLWQSHYTAILDAMDEFEQNR